MLSNKTRATHQVTRETQILRVRCYAAHLVDVNKYLAVFPGANISDKFYTMELNENLLKSIANRWIKQAYVQGYDYE